MNIKNWKFAPLRQLSAKLFPSKIDKLNTRACRGCGVLIPSGMTLCDTCFNGSEEVK